MLRTGSFLSRRRGQQSSSGVLQLESKSRTDSRSCKALISHCQSEDLEFSHCAGEAISNSEGSQREINSLQIHPIFDEHISAVKAVVCFSVVSN